VRKGARGLDSKVAQIEPIVVSAVRSSVANAGENRAPARTFYEKDGSEKVYLVGGKQVINYPDDASRN
jgi:hypothetical protein